MNVMELKELLDNYDPMTLIVVNKNDMEVGYHYGKVSEIKEVCVKMTEKTCVDAFDGEVFTQRVLLDSHMERPNSFMALEIR